MKLEQYRHLWGVEGSHADTFGYFKSCGYAGVETALMTLNDDQIGELKAEMDKHDLKLLAQGYTANFDKSRTLDEHVKSFHGMCVQAKAFGVVKLNVHSGDDAWDDDQMIAFYEQAVAIEKEVGIVVAHETHRSRCFFHPRPTAKMLERFETLKICADYSHWVCVCERLIDDYAEILKLCAPRVEHLHMRVGFAEGPQVPDPSVPGYAGELAGHEKWWDEIWAVQRAAGVEVFTACPEFGPPRYLHTDPVTGKPLADLDTVVNWQMRRQQERFDASA